jgi:hypothetical protein
MTRQDPEPLYSEERWREAGRREMNTILRNEDNLPRYGSSRQPSTPPSNYEGVITESTVWHNTTPPTPYSQEEEDHIEYERRLVDTILQETEKIRNTPF